MPNNLMCFHSQNRTKTHIADFTEGICTDTVNAPVGEIKISGPLAANTRVSLTAPNCINLPYEYKIITYSALNSLFTGLYANTEYVFYCDRIEADGDEGPVLAIDGNTIRANNQSHSLPAQKAIKFTPNKDNPEVHIYSNGWSYSNSSGFSATIYGMRIYRSGISTDVYYPYKTPQIITVPYDLGENDYIMSENGIVYMYKDSALSDITSTETGAALLSLSGYYPITVCTRLSAKLRKIGEPQARMN